MAPRSGPGRSEHAARPSEERQRLLAARLPHERAASAMTRSQTSEPASVLYIRPAKGLAWPHPRELWDYRELFLTWRDISVRYKQTALGATWAILQPLLMMFLFTVVFSRLAKVPSDGIPYPVFAFCGLLPWQLFAYALTYSSNSLVDNSHVLTKVYFPRLILPLAAVMAGLVDFAIAFLVLAGMMVYYGISPGRALITLPLFTMLAVSCISTMKVL